MASEYKMTVENKMAAYDECRLCPRMCGAHRSEGKKGFCGMVIGNLCWRERRFICGKNHAFQVRAVQELYFLPDVRCDVFFVRIMDIAAATYGRRSTGFASE